MTIPSLIQWRNTWQTLGLAAGKVPELLYKTIIANYNEPGRYYHTLAHLNECFVKLAELKDLAIYPAEIELALWFHDAIYQPSQQDNELRCAQWAQTSLLEADLDQTVADRIHDLIMATQHHAKPEHIDAKILVDADLAILGADPARFKNYTVQIRQEYAWVSEPVYRLKRAEILRHFLAQPAIFNTGRFIERYEQIARNNLLQALEQL